MRSIVRIGILLLLMFSSTAASAQFYNGMQMNFGKNRLQYNNRYWKYYRFDRFDVYSYENGTDLSLYVADFVEKELALIERFFDYSTLACLCNKSGSTRISKNIVKLFSLHSRIKYNKDSTGF